jgi:glycosyltransferase involved in cell wall biosynthesis
MVSDNASHDDTKKVVNSAIVLGFPITYIKNFENIGSDANIAQCFNKASGKYVLILGDDDLLVDGSLNWLMGNLASSEYGLVCMRSYGFNLDFKKEYPGVCGETIEFSDAGDYLYAVGPALTLISTCIVNKSILKDVDANQFSGSNLVQVHLNLLALLASSKNLLSTQYHIACKRNNSGGYNFIQVFVERLGGILDSYQAKGLSASSIKKFDRRMMIGYLPFYLLKQRLENLTQAENIERLEARYKGSLLYRVWLKPVVVMPRYLAIIWGVMTTFLGRIFYGDLRRSFYFLLNKLR